MVPRDDVHVEEPSLGNLVSRMTGDLGTLVRKEIELAKLETKQEVSRAAKAGGKMGAAGFAGYLSALFLSFAVALLLDTFMPAALAFALVAVAYGIGALVLLKQGRKEIKDIRTLPETTETIKEDITWAKAQKH